MPLQHPAPPLLGSPRPLRFAVGALVTLALLSVVPARGKVPRNAGRDAPGVASLVEVDPTADGWSDPGALLPSAPDLDPIPAQPTLEDIRLNLVAGDTNRALHLAERFLEQHKWGRERDAAAMVVGLTHREQGRHNLASETFTTIRSGKGPLAEWGAWYEAEQDLARGRQWVAIKECEKYLTDWPTGRFRSGCMALIARAHADLGRYQSARAAAVAYDDDHEGAEIGEQIELRLALWEAREDPAGAVDNLQKLALEHDAPLTGRVAEERLAELALAGVPGATLPQDTESLKLRALSLRRARRNADAWSAFEELARRAQDDPKLQEWVDEQAEDFGWRTRRWNFLADWYQARIAEKPDAEAAWNRYRVLERAGRYPEALEQARLGMKNHARSKEWNRQEEAIARTFLLGGDYVGARALLDTVAAQGGWTGHRAAFFAGFASFMAHEYDDAVKRLTVVADRNKSYDEEARYWRARALQALERHEEAQVDLAWLAEHEPNGWYALLARQGSPDLPQLAPFRRDGTWPGPELPPRPTAPHWAADAPFVPIAAPTAPRPESHAAAFGALSWPLASLVAPPVPEPEPVVLARDPVAPPPGYQAGAFFDPVDARAKFAEFADKNAQTWPELQAVHDLARAGLYDLSGPLMSELFEDWRAARTASSHPHHAAARNVFLPTESWRALFLHARDHHHSARFTYDLWVDVEDPEVAQQAWRLAYPLAHDQLVWHEAREAGVDPFLVLGLMRQESTYNPIAVSRVGARGAMQIMPSTGHLLANLEHDVEYTARDLEDPTIAVGYGIRYLGLLLDRFDDVYPLAVASYNGGPHNVSYWLAGTGSDMPMDAFVELIPFRETRDYVKKVSSGYARYLDLHAPGGTALVLPTTPRGDHPDIVDF